MFRLLELLDHPHKKYPVIHITGTKGKGSVSAFLASILYQAGYKVGLYTSPHLIDYTERIQVDGKPIDKISFLSILDEIKPAIEKVPEITTFEITTALAMTVFARQEVDFAVLEVGLGGRLDATNVVDPLVSVITTVSYDHQAVLGDTLAAIAGEKAGIIKPGRTVVVSNQSTEAYKVIEQRANELGSPLLSVGKDVLYVSASHSLDGQRFLVWQPHQQGKMDQFLENPDGSVWHPMEYITPLLGAHQIENAVTAFLTIQTVRAAGYEISEQAVADGFLNVSWHCRFEVISRNPLIVLDSAHNRDSAQKLRITLDDYLPGKNILLLFGASEDKDVHGILVDLLPRVNKVIATQTIHPRAMEASSIVKLVHQMGKPARAILPFQKAFEEITGMAGPNEAVLVAGSIFLAAAAREVWLDMSGMTKKE
jgi:dihydrofolate synthase/folylpolyglutamate synthase